MPPPNPTPSVPPVEHVVELTLAVHGILMGRFGVAVAGPDENRKVTLALAPLIGSMVQSIVAIQIHRKDL